MLAALNTVTLDVQWMPDGSTVVCGIVPPERYPREVWDTLVRQKKLVDRGRGTYELAPGV